ncbi:MAG: hypothetical protein ABW069_02085 [Duganella sp.]
MALPMTGQGRAPSIRPRTAPASPGSNRNGKQCVALATIRAGGHTWPGADPFNVGLPLGKTTRDIDANETIWQFFSQHQLD